MAAAADLPVPARETRARRLPAVLERVRWPLVAIVAFGFVLTVWFVTRVPQYFIQPDELEYLKQSRRIAEQLHPLLPGDRYFNSWSQLQPLLLAPVWAIDDRNVAHDVMGIVNAAIMASAAIPAYLLTRRVIPSASRIGAYLVAFLTVAIPWMAAASTMMTEVAAYPAFLWGVLAVQHAVARPSPRGDVIGLLGVGLAFSARPQLAVLAPALVAGVLAQELRFAGADDPLERRRTRIARSLRAAAGRHWPLLVVTLLGLLVYAAFRPDVFGGYSDSGVTAGVLDAPGLLDFSRETLAYIAVGVALLPLGMAAGWVLGTLWRPAGREQHAYAVVALVTVVLLTIAVGSFTARYTPQGINSRYLFYLAPLLFVGMAALLAERRPFALPVGLGALLTGWVVYGSQLSQSGPSLVSPDQTFHTVLDGRTFQVGRAIGLPELSAAHLLGVAALVALLALALLRRGAYRQTATAAAAGLVALFCVAETGYSLQRIADTQAGVDQAFIDGRRWVDEALPPGAKAQAILSTFGDPASAYGVWWDLAFWNNAVDRALVPYSTPDLQQPFPEQFIVLGDGSFAGWDNVTATPGIFGDGPWFLRAAGDRSFGFRDAEVVAERYGVQLVRTNGAPRAAWALAGAADDVGRILTGAPPAELQLFPREPGSRAPVPARVTLTTLPGATEPARYAVGDVRGRVRPGKTVTVELDARVGEDGVARVPLRSPGSPDAATPAGVQVAAVEVLD
ncbi:MAG TPA: hypothetical protein VFR97_04905 [Capillimicrobium sp.]|nr:hypothetical protein [Capillimicrobium sp.]